LKRERWGSPLVQGKYREEKTCDKRHPHNDDDDDDNNNNKVIAIGLSPSGSGYFTCKQNMNLVTNKFKSGGLREKHVVATWNPGNLLRICL